MPAACPVHTYIQTLQSIYSARMADLHCQEHHTFSPVYLQIEAFLLTRLCWTPSSSPIPTPKTKQDSALHNRGEREYDGKYTR